MDIGVGTDVPIFSFNCIFRKMTTPWSINHDFGHFIFSDRFSNNDIKTHDDFLFLIKNVNKYINLRPKGFNYVSMILDNTNDHNHTYKQ